MHSRMLKKIIIICKLFEKCLEKISMPINIRLKSSAAIDDLLVLLFHQPSQTTMQISNKVGGLFYRSLAIQQQGVCHSHGTICHAIERQSILLEKLFQLVTNLNKINSDREAHPEIDLKKSDLILSN